MATQSLLDSTRELLGLMQQFDVSKLRREADLGKQMSFSGVLESAQALVDIYKRIPLAALDDFSDTQLNSISQQADNDYTNFNGILAFDLAAPDAANNRTKLIETVKRRRDQLFDQLWQYVAYGVARTTDTSLLEAEARKVLQSIERSSKEFAAQMQAVKKDADDVLAGIRAVAAEHGVSQKAVYFKQEANEQEDLAAKWLNYTYWFAIGFGILAIGSLFAHKIEWLRPDGRYEMVQFISGKLLIFSVLGYMLVMASRNYSTHKHNAVVNRHRQNALLTYNALVEASGSSGTGDIVLAHAASCIFSPQETGFSHGKGETFSGPNSSLEILTKSVSGK
jgi:hypothetical protein